MARNNQKKLRSPREDRRRKRMNGGKGWTEKILEQIKNQKGDDQ
ncbi:hypothetical protein [Halobacillus sp. GSS1]|nr:hypothetical protein [Halobacillus sp. GSS1]